MVGRSAAALIVGALALAAAQHAVAGKRRDKGGNLDRKPVTCIWLSQLHRTEVVNDKTVLFYMYDGTIYRNTLRDKCFDLAHADAFGYRAFSAPQLCRTDSITPFDLGLAVAPIPCRLGRFVPIDRTEAKDMLGGPKNALALQNEVQVKQVKLPPDGASTAARRAQSASAAGSGAAPAPGAAAGEHAKDAKGAGKPALAPIPDQPD